MHLLRFLKWLLGLHISSRDDKFTDHMELLQVCKHTVECSLDTFKILHGHGLWLDRTCAVVYRKLMGIVRGYKLCARMVYDLKLAGFGLKPKLHALLHIACAIRCSLGGGAPLVLSPLATACEQNEDLVGKNSRLGRQLDTRGMTCRVLQRHFYKKRALLSREKPRKV